jgi:hypothetical protein
MKTCKKCGEIKINSDFYQRRLICKVCFKVEKKSKYIYKRKPIILTDEFKICNYCGLLLNGIYFYKNRYSCKECAKEIRNFETKPIESFFEPNALKEIHQWIIDEIIPELNKAYGLK